jgi:hypothetical protein
MYLVGKSFLNYVFDKFRENKNLAEKMFVIIFTVHQRINKFDSLVARQLEPAAARLVEHQDAWSEGCPDVPFT